ncbi:juvenile hormone esterase-like [Phlebotomus papatasi]|uniref:juvenile hormone esterase-like n=1 Tax=Phlebotomus papatasi TaxID=29031 RepID=UPI0024837DBE|nr:juvenile hormone esterase-like [Phlebotomus papatasi]
MLLLLFLLFGNTVLQINSQISTVLDDGLSSAVGDAKGPRPQPEVCAKAGCVRGKFVSGLIKPYEAFYGIPYAEPPVGMLRFENPVPFSGWSGYWDATYTRDVCLQRDVFKPDLPILGSEDCLYLNVYRPLTWKKGKNLPVLVFIPGGAFTSWSGDPTLFGPEYFMGNGEIILVTLNYRLGIFGFLSSGDGVVKGNFAFKDQQLALQWVKTNIKFFGGDKNSITVSGQSAGAAGTHLQLLSPKSQDLFHRAIMMSGTAITSILYPIDFAAQFRSSAKYLGILNWDTDTTLSLTNQMKNTDALDILLLADNFYVFPGTPASPWRVCVEGNWEGAFITEDPRKTWLEGNFVQKPILTSLVSNEGFIQLTLFNETLRQSFNENIYELLGVQLDIDPRYVPDIMRHYFGSKTYIDETNLHKYFEMFGDRLFRYPFFKLVQQYLRYADLEKNPIYLTEFGFESALTFFKSNEYLGVAHSDDLIYLFSSADFPPLEPNSPEGRMSDILVQTIVNFVARGEVKAWTNFTPCTPETSTPFCDRQEFLRNHRSNPDQVIVKINNYIDLQMVKLWDDIENDVNSTPQKL